MKKALPYLLIAGVLVVGYLLLGGESAPAPEQGALLTDEEEAIEGDHSADAAIEEGAAAEEEGAEAEAAAEEAAE